MKIAVAILSTGISCSAALAVMIFVLLSCGDLSSSAPAGAVCPSNLAEAMKTAMASCQKETKALEEDATLAVPLPESVSVKSGALRFARSDISEPIGDRRFRRFGRGATISPVNQEEGDEEEDDAPSTSPPRGSTSKPSGRVQRAVTEKEDRRRREADSVTEGGEGKKEEKDRRRRQASEDVTPSKGEEGKEEEGRKERSVVDAHEIVAVAGHHKKPDDCDVYRRRRGADQQKMGEMLSCAANKLVSEHPVLNKVIDSCKDVEEDNDQFEECFKSNLKESCPDMPMIE